MISVSAWKVSWPSYQPGKWYHLASSQTHSPDLNPLDFHFWGCCPKRGWFSKTRNCSLIECVKADRHEATLPCNYCMQPCYATYAMSNHDVQRLHGKRCTPRLRGKVDPFLSAFRRRNKNIFLEVLGVLRLFPVFYLSESFFFFQNSFCGDLLFYF